MYDLILASLFFLVVFSPLAINAWPNWVKTVAFRYEGEETVPRMKVGAALIE